MIDQSKQVTQILKELKNVGIPTSQIEDELPIAKGYLWKVKSGLKFLTEERLSDLEKYHAKNCKKVVHKAPVILHTQPKKQLPPAVKPQITIPIKSKEEKAIKPGSLADMMKAARSESNRPVAAPYQRKKY